MGCHLPMGISVMLPITTKGVLFWGLPVWGGGVALKLLSWARLSSCWESELRLLALILAHMGTTHLRRGMITEARSPRGVSSGSYLDKQEANVFLGTACRPLGEWKAACSRAGPEQAP